MSRSIGDFVVAGHGGQCCGINHVYCFGDWADKERLEELKLVVEHFKKRGQGYYEEDMHDYGNSPRRGLLEATLTSDQLVSWRKPLEEMGWKDVHSFYNSNSENTVHLLVLDVQDTEF